MRANKTHAHLHVVSLLFCFFLCCSIALTFQSASFGYADEDDSRQDEGLRRNTPARYLLTGATIHVSPENTIENASILIDRQKIAAVAVDMKAPAGVQTIDMAGKHIYAGFVDSFVPYPVPIETGVGTTYWNEKIRPQISVAQHFDFKEIKAKELRESGFTAALIAPAGGILKGQSSLMLLSDEDREHALVASDVAQHVRLTVDRRFGRPRGTRPSYPNSPMGAMAMARQAIYDALWYKEAWQVANTDATVERPETNVSLASLQDIVGGKQPVIIDTTNELYALRAERFAKEFDLQLVIKGSGNEYRRLKEIAALKRPIILPIDFPMAPDVSSPELAMNTTLESLMHWDIAPENPARLAGADVTFALTSNGHKKKSKFLDNLRKAVKRGLDPNVALAALTTNPAKIFDVEQQLGTIQPGKIANLTVTDRDLFDKKCNVVETWIGGKRFEPKPKPLRLIDGKWEIETKKLGKLTLDVSQDRDKLSANIVLPKKPVDQDDEVTEQDEPDRKEKRKRDSNEIELRAIALNGLRLSGAFKTEKLDLPGACQLTLILGDNENATGNLVLPDGTIENVTAKKVESEETDGPDNEEKKNEDEDEIIVAASFDVNYPLGGYGLAESPEPVSDLLIKNATVWTCGDQGIIENGAVLISDGKIQAVFDDKSDFPSADRVIDAEGKHITPGIIDCHSHMATDSGVNESGQAVTAEVRIGDYIDCDDINIYRQLAGGVTAANILHGSSNPIGGQNQVIKLRWGACDEEMKFQNAPAGIKFALGENVKRSNSSDTTRYPQTRMGVEQIIHDAFRAASEYRARHQQWKSIKKGLPPRVDLELEALAEIMEGTRWIHCHSYRQDEILALIRLLDSYDVTIGTFQHILEGYKVADKMAEHNAMGSAFADWWAYKYEVIDAIPFGGALMDRAGVVVSFNSDDAELGRHLNHEAVKAVRYGGVSEEEALKFVTLNPARQLRIDDRVGSIEPGKDADIVLWSGPPLSNLSRCEQTWVDGRKYFDRENDIEVRQKNSNMRTALIQKALVSGEKPEQPKDKKIDPAKLWLRYDESCGHHSHNYNDDYDY